MMKGKKFMLFAAVSCAGLVLVHGADTKAKTKSGAESQKETASDLPVPLPLPAGPTGTAEGVNPLVKIPAEGFTPFVPILDGDQKPVPPDDLTGWQIMRMPARENRDACAAFWSRVASSRTQWTVMRDTASGAAKAVAGFVPEKAANLPKFTIMLNGGKRGAESRELELMPDEVRKVSDGWLVAQRKDPVLAWFGPDGKQSRVISTVAVVSLTASGDQWFALCPERRSLVELTFQGKGQGGERWAMVDFQKLPGLPRAMTVLPDGRFCVVTQDQLLAVSLDRKVEVLLAHPGWAGFNPGSVVYDEKADRVFVGLRHFVARCALEPGKRGSVLLRPTGG